MVSESRDLYNIVQNSENENIASVIMEVFHIFQTAWILYFLHYVLTIMAFKLPVSNISDFS